MASSTTPSSLMLLPQELNSSLSFIPKPLFSSSFKTSSIYPLVLRCRERKSCNWLTVSSPLSRSYPVVAASLAAEAEVNLPKGPGQMVKVAVLTQVSRLHETSIGLHPKSSNALQIRTCFVLKKRGAVRVFSGTDGAGLHGGEPSSESKEENVPIENLPLESKLQLKLEQKMRMKLAKKIRLRRKKLVRKRRLRKKGRWPPSKMKKNKNV